MTDARLGGLGREALVTDAGEVRLAGIAREALVAGVGLAARINARSRARGSVSVLSSGTTLHGTAKAGSRARAGPLTVHINIAGRVKARSSIRAGMASPRVLAGRVSARSSVRLLRTTESIWDLGASVWDSGTSHWDRAPAVLAGRITAHSQASTVLNVPGLATRQYAVSVNNA